LRSGEIDLGIGGVDGDVNGEEQAEKAVLEIRRREACLAGSIEGCDGCFELFGWFLS
jgi:hypothetical protein